VTYVAHVSDSLCLVHAVYSCAEILPNLARHILDMIYMTASRVVSAGCSVSSSLRAPDLLMRHCGGPTTGPLPAYEHTRNWHMHERLHVSSWTPNGAPSLSTHGCPCTRGYLPCMLQPWYQYNLPCLHCVRLHIHAQQKRLHAYLCTTDSPHCRAQTTSCAPARTSDSAPCRTATHAHNAPLTGL
jgi:hypothetical protein